VMAETVAQLNKTLAKTSIKKITLLAPNSANANIRVYFAPIEHFPRVAKFHGFRYVQGNWGYFWTFWNRRNEINRAYVLLATDKLKGASLRHFALEELTQSLGLSNDSSQFRDSIFYSGRDGGGTAQQLSPADRRLIIFFYNHVRPGTKGDELRALLRRHW